MDTINLPQVVEKFVAAINAHDLEALAAVFGDEATVQDDGLTHTGKAEIRAWVQSHLIAPKIVLTPTSFAGNRLVASGDGDFPGGPASFAFMFGVRNDEVIDLAIEPA